MFKIFNDKITVKIIFGGLIIVALCSFISYASVKSFITLSNRAERIHLISHRLEFILKNISAAGFGSGIYTPDNIKSYQVAIANIEQGAKDLETLTKDFPSQATYFQAFEFRLNRKIFELKQLLIPPAEPVKLKNKSSKKTIQPALSLKAVNEKSAKEREIVAEITKMNESLENAETILLRNRLADAGSRSKWVLLSLAAATFFAIFFIAVSTAFLIVELSRRKKSERLLLLSEKRYHTIVENIRDACFIHDFEGNIIDVNRNACFMMSYELKELVGFNLEKIDGEKNGLILKQKLRELVSQGELVFELVFLDKHGRSIPVQVSSKVVRTDVEGGESFVQSFVRDITEERNAADEISRLSAAVEQSANIIMITDVRGRVIYVNKAFEKITGFTRAEIEGKDVSVMESGEHSGQYHDNLWSTIESGNIWEGEIKNKKKDGSFYWQRSLISPVKNDRGEIFAYIAINEDVTERKQFESDLQEAREDYRELVNNLNVGISRSEASAPGKILRANDALANILGYKSVNDIMSIDMEKFYQNSKDRFDLITELKNRGFVKNREINLLKKNGELIVVAISAKGVFDADSKLKFIDAVLEDITARKRLEIELARLTTAVSQSANIIVMTDVDGTISYVNRAFEIKTGYSFEEVLGKNPRLLKSGEHSREFYQGLWATIKSGGVWRGQFKNRKKDGSFYWEDVLITPVKNDKKEIISYIAVKEDVTDRKSIEEAFTKVSRRLALIVESAGEGIFGVDLEDKITFVNPAALEMFGWKEYELIGKTQHETLHHTRPDGKIYPKNECPISGVCRGGVAQPKTEEVFWRKDGTKFFVEYTCAPMNEDDKAVGAVVVFRDISERKELERLKDEFISTVSHELRTPLTTIREAVSQVLDGILGPTTKAQQEFLAMCLQDADRLKIIIDDLLDVSRLEAGKMRIRKEVFDMVELVNGIKIAFYPLAQTRGIELKTVFSSKKLEVNADKDRINQVLMNLVGNSLKFTEKGFVEISLSDTPEGLMCRVADSGRGIAKEDLPRMFSKFQQFGRIAGPGEKGTGLGLSIVKGIVELHQGKLWAESELDKGTKIFFTLPK